MSRYGQRTRIGQAVSNFGQPVARTGVGGYGIATGGTESDITVGGINYRLLTFNSSSTLTITAAGMFDIFQVGGGGGSAATAFVTHYAGGGGAGGIQDTTQIFYQTDQTVTVGAGGVGAANGSQTSIGSSTIAGGGYGGARNTAGGNGACGGGGINFFTNGFSPPSVSG